MLPTGPIPGGLKIMTIAPERTRGLRCIRLLKKNGIVPAIGHTDASYEVAREAAAQGVTYSTHVFNRMSGITSRRPGVITEILLNDAVTAEVIADGHHVHPALLRLLVKNKPLDKIVLVTDSVAAMDTKALRVIKGVYMKEDYTIAGSRLHLLQAVKNMVYFTGISLCEAVAMATVQPARLIKVHTQKGVLKPGFDADIVIFDEEFRCRATIIGGRIVFKRK